MGVRLLPEEVLVDVIPGAQHEKAYKLCGILNGIDVAGYDPKTDPDVYAHYTPKKLAGKAENKQKLQERLG